MAVSVVLPYGLRDPETLESLADVINGLPLGRGDFVYLMEAQGDEALAEQEVRRQRESLKASPRRDACAPRAGVSDYNPAKQWT